MSSPPGQGTNWFASAHSVSTPSFCAVLNSEIMCKPGTATEETPKGGGGCGGPLEVCFLYTASHCGCLLLLSLPGPSVCAPTKRATLTVTHCPSALILGSRWTLPLWT